MLTSRLVIRLPTESDRSRFVQLFCDEDFAVFSPEARGMDYCIEAGRAVLTKAAETFSGQIFAIIDPTNHASQNVARKLGLSFGSKR